jgi:RNA polymerase sigma-70 factor (ECF subfamily)
VQAGEEQLQVQQAQAGDRQAYAALVERYWARVFRWLFGLTRREQLAEDLTQEAFLKAWKSLRSFQIGASFRAWLFRIARNCLIDSQRGPRGAASQPLPAGVADRNAGPVEVALEHEGQDLLAAACRRLPVHFQQAYLLWAEDELSFAEIAQALDTTEETARLRVFKARLFLVGVLGCYLDRKKP